MIELESILFSPKTFEQDLIAWNDNPSCLIHREILRDLEKLSQSLQHKNHQLKIVSAYRSIERQTAIWNEKVLGRRKVVDDKNHPVDLSTLTPWERAQAILRFSALPGTSRHHWGTDFDVVEENCAKNLSCIELTHTEAVTEFKNFHHDLSELISQKKAFGFFRPYEIDHGGVATELWHLSYSPIAKKLERQQSLELYKKLINSLEVELKQTILENFEEIYSRFILTKPS